MTARALATSAALAVLAGPLSVAAQSNPIPEFDKLRTPASPALVLLGISPAKIARPNTPATLSASLIESFGQDRAHVPNGYSLEVAPYWLFPHPTLTLDSYAQDPASLARTFTISLATSDSADTSGVGASQTMLSLGLRTMLVSSPETLLDKPCIADAQNAATSVAQSINEIVVPWIMEHPEATASEIEEQRQRAFETALEEAPSDVKQVIEDKTRACVDILAANRGFTLDLAGGMAWSFADGTWETGKAALAGFWLTPSWRAGDHGNIVGIASANWQGLDGDTTRFVLDGGIRGIYAWKSLAVSLETIYRRVSGELPTENQFRVDLGFDVELFDGVWLTSTFGKDFSADDARSLLAIANLQWNIGNRSINPKAPI
jgi:hypothetical protein